MNRFNRAAIVDPVPCEDLTLVPFFGMRTTGWTPGGADDAPTEVHLVFWNLYDRVEPMFAMDSREKVDQVIEMLAEMRDRVFPDAVDSEPCPRRSQA